MRILITGAAGFVGQHLARELLKDASHSLILTDIVEPAVPRNAKNSGNATCIQADLSSESAKVVTQDLDAAFVFHGIMSSGSEANFELGLSVNVDATRALLDTMRTTCPGVKVIYASSGAVYGQPLPEVVTEAVVPTPESSYGAEKMICEYLINEYTRRGFITGFSLRFPTITVRPGKPTAAASSFLSGMIREPIAGKECVIPVRDREFRAWLCSPRTLVHNLLVALGLPRDALPPHIRALNIPGFAASIQEMMDALAEVGGADKLALLKEQEDPAMKRILLSWAAKYDNSKALALGMKADTSFVEVVRDYVGSLTAETSE